MIVNFMPKFELGAYRIHPKQECQPFLLFFVLYSLIVLWFPVQGNTTSEDEDKYPCPTRDSKQSAAYIQNVSRKP